MKVSDEAQSCDAQYMPGLDGLRAFAALSVVLGHVLERDSSVAFAYILSGITLDGSNAVNLFLVLSGFLITRLLLAERERTGAISARRFLLRRACRILPLYYVVLTLGICLPFAAAAQVQALPLTSWQIVALAMPFTANLIFPTGGSLVILWTIGIEEQFYAAWSTVVRHQRIVIVAMAMIGARIALSPFVEGRGVALDERVDALWYTLRYDCLAIGALTAVLHTRFPGIVRRITSRPIRIASFALFAALVGFALKPGVATEIFVSCVSALLIINVVGRPGLLELPMVRWVGLRSYGVYMWHMLVLAAFYSMGVRGLALVGAVVAGTLGVSALSYRYIETPFLRLKPKASQTMFLARTLATPSEQHQS